MGAPIRPRSRAGNDDGQPRQETDHCRAPRGREIQRLTHGNHHGDQHPHRDDAEHDRTDTGQASEDTQYTGCLGEPQRSHQLAHVCVRLRFWQQTGADDVCQEGPDDPGQHRDDHTGDDSHTEGCSPAARCQTGQEHHAQRLSRRVAVRLDFLVNPYVELRDADHSSRKTGHGRNLLTATIARMALRASLLSWMFIVDPGENPYTPTASACGHIFWVAAVEFKTTCQGARNSFTRRCRCSWMRERSWERHNDYQSSPGWSSRPESRSDGAAGSRRQVFIVRAGWSTRAFDTRPASEMAFGLGAQPGRGVRPSSPGPTPPAVALATQQVTPIRRPRRS